jgi:peptidoglycan/LPS O-acetylase OafA/YrhL
MQNAKPVGKRMLLHKETVFKTSIKRNFGLDLLRAAAIAGVFLGHAVGALARLTTFLDLFFVLSGFLIGRVYFQSRKDGSFSPWKFWLSRWWRTLPPYYAALIFFALSILWDPKGAPIDWKYLFFLQNFSGIKGFFPSWSLCVEEHFYLVLPLLALAVEKTLGRRSLLWVLPLLFLVPSLLLLEMIHHLGGIAHVPVPWHVLKWTPFSTQPLTAGVWMAFLNVEKSDWFGYAKRPALLLAVILVPIIFSLPGSGGTLWLICTYSAIKAIGFAALLRVTYELRWNPVTQPGRWMKSAIRGTAITSYSIYLMHTLFTESVLRYTLSWPRSPAKSALIVFCMVLPCLPFYFLFEKPSIVSRDRFLKRKVRPQPVAV